MPQALGDPRVEGIGASGAAPPKLANGCDTPFTAASGVFSLAIVPSGSAAPPPARRSTSTAFAATLTSSHTPSTCASIEALTQTSPVGKNVESVLASAGSVRFTMPVRSRLLVPSRTASRPWSGFQ